MMSRSSRFTLGGGPCGGSGTGQQAGVGEEAGVGDHAVVGAHRLALDVPAAVQHLDRLGQLEAAVRRAPRAAATAWMIDGV